MGHPRRLARADWNRAFVGYVAQIGAVFLGGRGVDGKRR